MEQQEAEVVSLTELNVKLANEIEQIQAQLTSIEFEAGQFKVRAREMLVEKDSELDRIRSLQGSGSEQEASEVTYKM